MVVVTCAGWGPHLDLAVCCRDCVAVCFAAVGACIPWFEVLCACAACTVIAAIFSDYQIGHHV